MNERGSGEPGSGAPGDQLRQAAVDALSEAFAQDVIPVEEFERRVELAHRAESYKELQHLLSDLPKPQLPAKPGAAGHPGAGTSLQPSSPRAMATHVPEQTVILGVLGGGVRKGAWHPARYNYAIGVLGGCELDFRDCALPPVTDVRCFAVMGGVEVIVPPDVIVETSGVGIMGGFEQVAEDQDAPSGAPVIRINGLALMGGVEVNVRYPGETAGEAKKRRKLAKKERKRLRDGGA